MSKLETAKKIIKENIENARFGIFDCPNFTGDSMVCLYAQDGLKILICFSYEYFEVFGLTNEEFEELSKYYDSLQAKEKN